MRARRIMKSYNKRKRGKWGLWAQLREKRDKCPKKGEKVLEKMPPFPTRDKISQLWYLSEKL